MSLGFGVTMRPQPLAAKRSVWDAIARELRLEMSRVCGKKPMSPCDPFRLARNLGIRVEEVAASHGRGNLYKGKTAWTITIPTTLPFVSQRFSCAHELGHYLLHALRIDLIQEISSHFISEADAWRAEEYVCNSFAQELLLPADEVKKYVTKGRSQLLGFRQLMEDFRCSLQTTAIRVAQLQPNYAFVFTLIEKDGPRKGELAVAWTATPTDIFLPKRKRLPLDSCIVKAYQTGTVAAGIEENFLGQLKGSHFIEAIPLAKTRGAFAIVHLQPPSAAVQPPLPYPAMSTTHEAGKGKPHQLRLPGM